MIIEKCKLCKAYSHNGVEAHGFVDSMPCPNMSETLLRNTLKTYFDEYQKTNKKLNMMQSNVQLKLNRYAKETEDWKGKYFILKHENNKLRANKIYPANG